MVCARPASKPAHILAMARRVDVCGGFVGRRSAEFCNCSSMQPFEVWPHGPKLQAPIPKGVGSRPTAGIYSHRLDFKLSTTKFDEHSH